MPQVIGTSTIVNPFGLSYNASTGILNVVPGVPFTGVQVGQRMRLANTISVPTPLYNPNTATWNPPMWQSGYSYAALSIITDPQGNAQMATYAFTSSGTIPDFLDYPGGYANDGSNVNAWIMVAPDVSWRFDGDYTITAVTLDGGGHATNIQAQVASGFRYFNPFGQGTGGGGDLFVYNTDDKIAEIHNIAAMNPSAPSFGLIYEPTVAYTQGVHTVTLTTSSPILTAIYNQVYNGDQQPNPILYSIYVRLIDTNSYLGVDFNGVYQILTVLSPTSFVVQPLSTQFIPNDFGGGGTCQIFQAESTAVPSGFLDTADAIYNVGAPVSDDSIDQLSVTAKFSSIRKESFNMGFWENGQQIKPPISAVDGYEYSYGECSWEWYLASSNGALRNNAIQYGPFTGGTKWFPQLSLTTEEGWFVSLPYVINVDQSGNVTCQMFFTNQDPGGSAFNTNFSNGQTNQGIIHVTCNATRASVPIVLTPQQLAPPPL